MKLVVIFAVVLLSSALAGTNETCHQLEDFFSPEVKSIFINATVRWVDSELGNDTKECLNGSTAVPSSPCQSLQYALFEGNTSSLVIHLSPGRYTFTNTTTVADAERVALMGAGVESTIAVCGKYLDVDEICDYRNFQIRRSSHVYIYGITFSQCGPITSNVYIAKSNFVFFNECRFR